MGLKDGRAICDGCGRSVPANDLPRGFIIISSGRIKEQCVRIRISYGLGDDGKPRLLESFIKVAGVFCGAGCLDHFAHTGRPRGFGCIGNMTRKHSRGRPRLLWRGFGRELKMTRLQRMRREKPR